MYQFLLLVGKNFVLTLPCSVVTFLGMEISFVVLGFYPLGSSVWFSYIWVELVFIGTNLSFVFKVGFFFLPSRL